MTLFEDPDAALRAALYRRFAVVRGGAPARCDHEPHQKIIYATVGDALACARELGRLNDVSPRYAHPCRDHWHLTRKKKPTSIDTDRPGRTPRRARRRHGRRIHPKRQED